MNAALITFLAMSGGSGSIYGFSKHAEITPPEATKAAIDAAADGDVETAWEDRGSKQVLTVCLTKRAQRRVNRAVRAKRAGKVRQAVVEALEAERPQKIGPLVEKVGFDRAEVLDVLRAGRDAKKPVFVAQNETKSNFHTSWSLAASPEPFPAPVVEAPVVEKAEDGKDEAAAAS